LLRPNAKIGHPCSKRPGRAENRLELFLDEDFLQDFALQALYSVDAIV
jgi:hypothetical protein